MRMKAEKTVDCLGMYCPMPVVKTAKAIKEVPVGSVLEVIADDQGFLEDLPAWCKMTGNEFLGIEETDGELHGFVRRTA